MARNKRQKAASQEDGSKRKRHAPAPAAARPDLKSDELPDIEVAHQKKGRVYVLGMGDCGQLGLGQDISEKARPGPVNLPDEEQVVFVAAGGMHSACLTASGKVFTWGVNDEGALGRYTEGEAWKNSGLARGKPSDSYTPGLVEMHKDAAKIVALSAGDSHTLALDIKGAIYGWGTFRNASGIMGFSSDRRIAVKPTLVWKPTAEANQAVAVESGCDHVLVLCRSGNVLSWGCGEQGQLGRFGARRSSRTHTTLDTFLAPQPMHLPLSSRSHPVGIACGWYASYVILQNGEVFTCGLNNYLQLGCSKTENCVMVPKKASDLSAYQMVSIYPGEHHAFGKTLDGKLIGWGRPAYGRIGRADVDVNSDAGVGPGEVSVEGLEGPISGAAAGNGASGCFSSQMCGLWTCGFGVNMQLGKGDDDSDETTMTRVKRTKVFNEVVISQMQLGGQHVVMLALPFGGDEKKTVQNGQANITAAASKTEGKGEAAAEKAQHGGDAVAAAVEETASA